MKKGIKMTLIIIGAVVGIILLDTIQALALNNNPIIGTQTKCRSKQGLFVTTYHCDNGRNITKFRKSSCSTEDICGIKLEELEHIHEIVDKKLEEYEKTNGNKYTNVAGTGVNQNLNMVVITLIDNSKNEQKRFRENIYNSKYITFEQGGPYTTSLGKLSLNIKSNTLTSKGATFILKNNTDEEYSYGEPYIIEKFENGSWKEINTLTGDPLSWNDILYILKYNEEREININWSYGYGELKSGTYRLVKNSFRKNNSPESRTYTVYAEFDIK